MGGVVRGQNSVVKFCGNFIVKRNVKIMSFQFEPCDKRSDNLSILRAFI